MNDNDKLTYCDDVELELSDMKIEGGKTDKSISVEVKPKSTYLMKVSICGDKPGLTGCKQRSSWKEE